MKLMDTPLAPRMLELLEKAADAFIRNINPCDVEWLTQQDVTLQESVDLSELIGRVLDDFIYEEKNRGKMKSDQTKLNQPELAAYEIKFDNFIKMCSEREIDVAAISHRYVLGDTAKEFDESIRRLKNAGLKLSIAQENRIYECVELDGLEF